MAFTVVFAYNSTNSIPSAGATRQTFDIVYADDSGFKLANERVELIDKSERNNLFGSRLRLKIKIGANILSLTTNRTFFTAFFKAQYRWVVYGNFKDTANSANQNLCEAIPVDDDIEVSVPYDRENGYEYLSQKVF